MCGIFGFASSPPADRGVAIESFFEKIDSLLAHEVDPSRLEGMTESEEEALLGTLRDALALTYGWVQREGFLQVLRDEAIHTFENREDAMGSFRANSARRTAYT